MFLELVASCCKFLPSLLIFTSVLRITIAVLQKPCQGNFGNFQGSGESRFGGFEKDRYFLKIPKWQHKFVWDYKRGKLVSYFLNNAAKTCKYGLKISIWANNLSMSFSLKHFFISVAISTQVASAPLIISNFKFEVALSLISLG